MSARATSQRSKRISMTWKRTALQCILWAAFATASAGAVASIHVEKPWMFASSVAVALIVDAIFRVAKL